MKGRSGWVWRNLGKSEGLVYWVLVEIGSGSMKRKRKLEMREKFRKG